jgi:hypothetical protein
MYRNGSRYFHAILLLLTILLNTQVVRAATPVPAAPGPPLSSSFSGPFWQVMTPIGGTAAVSNGHLFLNVPGGSNHDALTTGNDAVRVVQPIGNTNFDVSIKLDSTLAATNEGIGEGLMVISDASNFITYELAADGSNIHLSAEIVAGGVSRSVFDDGSFGQYQSPMYLRLTRTANVYGAYYSTDGLTWISATTFIDARIPKLVGPFASNYSLTPSNAIPVEMSVNWFKVQLAADRTTPAITWATPAPIATGTALSATQLNATANVPGSFMYNPAVGAVLATGTQQLTAVFSPTDATDYLSATAHTSLVMTPTTTPTPTPTPTPAPVGCGGPTINLNSGMSQSTLQSSIANAPKCALILFAAGTYNITGGLTLPCGVTITAAVPATPSNVVLSAAPLADSANIFTLGQGCTDPTTVSYLSSLHAGFLFVSTPNSNLTVTHNQVGDLPCCNNGAVDAGFFASDPAGSNYNNLTNAIITWNQFGDSTSCTGPNLNAFTYTGGDEGPDGGCTGMTISTSTNGVIFENNIVTHVGEGVHVTCYGTRCDDSVTPPGPITKGLVAKYNDINQIHRIAWEEQAEITSGVDIEFNILHDWLNPYFGSFGYSMACCANPASTAPYLVESNNIVLFNTVPTPQYGVYGYGFEAWGNHATYANNLVETSNYTWASNGQGAGPAIAWGYGIQYGNTTYQYNTVCGPVFATAGYIVSEGFDGVPSPTLTGNVTSASCATVTSVAPSITPSAGAQTFPLTVTVSDQGYTSGAQPLGNTGIWYTTDGSTPVPGSGTAQYLASGGTFVLNAAATVKADGMWGAANQPSSHPAGYGFVPSGVVTTAYSAGGAIKKSAGSASSSNIPTEKLAAAVATTTELPAGAASATLESVAISPSQPVVDIGSTTQLKAIATFDDGSVKDVTADFAWQSSDTRSISADASGLLAGLASGPATISGSYHGLKGSVSTSSIVGEVDWSGPIVITAGGTYTGNWQSSESKTPAVTVATTDPVTIENSHIRSAGDLIKTSVAGSNLTVRNSLGVALNSSVKGQPNGNFLEAASPARLDVENNYVENAQGGVIVHGYAGKRDGEQTIVIRANRARNLNGLLSDGNGGYLPGEGPNRTPAHFIQFDSVQSVPGIDVGWNEVINYPGRSLVEDNIEVYRSSGTANQPLEIHDTYIQGAYPYKPAQDAYTGGGIKTDGSIDDTAQDTPAFNSIHDNQVVGTVSYGIEFAAGHDNIAVNNRVISSGLLADGTKIAAQGVGLANGGVAGPSASMYNNRMRDNLVGWACWKSSCAQGGYRKDQFFPASPADYSTNSVVATRQITFNMENNEYQVWLNKLSAAAVTVGPVF